MVLAPYLWGPVPVALAPVTVPAEVSAISEHGGPVIPLLQDVVGDQLAVMSIPVIAVAHVKDQMVYHRVHNMVDHMVDNMEYHTSYHTVGGTI